MELLSPAGNVEKLKYAYAYGADAAYIGLKKFSLRVKADNFYDDEYKKVIELKKKYPQKRLHCALNISFHDEEIDALKANLDRCFYCAGYWDCPPFAERISSRPAASFYSGKLCKFRSCENVSKNGI